RHPEATLERLRQWATDPSVHVRRLVSEGTRTRLPWAPRLPQFQADPQPVLALLELLKDDPSEYVRRSVANNLNDIGKDHPDLLLDIARRWLAGAPEPRRRLVAHALRTAVKRGDAAAIAVLGFGVAENVAVEEVSISPAALSEGGRVKFQFALANPGATAQTVRADLRIHFVRTNGRKHPKVFKVREVVLPPGKRVRLAKTVSLEPMTTRRHYPGGHRAEALLNGRVVPLGQFELFPGLDYDPRLRLIAESYARLTGRALIPEADDLAAALWAAPRVIVAHGTQADPVFFYGNRLALEAFEMDFAAFTRLPSRYSAEPLAREERARLLERVSRDGYIDDYAGIRISSTGRRFRIARATVWNLVDAEGRHHGQAATFERWQPVAEG
ncbi:MAG: MEKHLA domain-containing protein, partial [Rhodocyclaceae bacterium]